MLRIFSAQSAEYRLLPGRLRVPVAGLKRDPFFAQYLKYYLENIAGIEAVSASPLTGRALIRFNPKAIGFTGILTAIQECQMQYGTKNHPVVQHGEAAAAFAAQLQKYHREAGNILSTPVIATVLTGGILGAVLLKRVAAGRSPLAASPGVLNVAALVTLVSGYPILKEGLDHLAQKKQINSDLLIFVATLLLLIMRESITGLSILWLVHLSHLYRHLIQARNHSVIRRMIVDPRYTRVTEGDRQEDVQLEDIKTGDELILGPSETIPVAGVVVKGQAQIDHAYMSGECLTKEVSIGDSIRAGTFIISGKIHLQALECGLTSQMFQIGKNVERKTWDKPLRSISGYHTNKIIPWTIGIAAMVYMISRDMSRALAVLLAGCPAAVVLSRQAALGSAVAAAAANDIYVKDAKYLELAKHVDIVLFDKTGTLTANSPEIIKIILLDRKYSEEKIIELAASAVQSTTHPVADMLAREASKRNLLLTAAESDQVTGLGVKANVQGGIVIVGNERFMIREEIKINRYKSAIMRLEHLGMSVLYIAVNHKLTGLIGFRDELNPDSEQAINDLKMLGVERVGIITGDSLYSAQAVARRLGIAEQWASVSPADKVQIIKSLRHDKRTILMVGDGIHDAPAMAAADIGVALTCQGHSMSLNSADVVIQGNDITKVPQLLRLSQYTGEAVRQNLCLSTGFGVIGIVLAAFRAISPASAMLLLNFSTLAVLVNSAKILTFCRDKKQSGMDLQRFNNSHSIYGNVQYGNAQQICFPSNMMLLPDEDADLPEGTEPAGGFHVREAQTVCKALKTSETGLGTREVLWRRNKYGMNVLEEGKKPSFWELLLNQFNDFMVQVLLGAAGLSFALGRSKDALLTLGIVAANAALGVVQERKAESSLEALQKMAAPLAKAFRDGQVTKINASDLVPGDIIELESGDRVPADARLLSAWELEVEEASLTGETLPVKKDALFLCSEEMALGDRRNMIFMGTSVTRGRAKAVVVATGMATEMGKVAQFIQHQEGIITPLQRRLEELGKYLVYGCLAVSALVFLVGILRGLSPFYMLQTAAGLAVAAIPEGLSAMVMIALAMGVQRMSKRNIIVRRLSAIETLGCATVICTDKTGTLTKNEMTVRSVFTGDRMWNITGEGYVPHGKFQCEIPGEDPAADRALQKTLLVGALCNNSCLINENHGSSEWRIEGDPTEGALLVAAAKAGIARPENLKSHLRLFEIPFESERRMMSVVCAERGMKSLYCKGSPDKVLAVCTYYQKNGEIMPLDEGVRQDIHLASEKMTAQALRVLGCAYRPVAVNETATDQSIEQNLIFCGLVGMIDPPRPEVLAAVDKCRKAGVKVVMITGDHPNTARAIAGEINLLARNEQILTGSEIDNMTDGELADIVRDVSVYARTSPHHKLRIIKALKAKGYVVAMTGDGVNDAPAIKAADIGIAMGRMGTDVTKEAASMTLADDNFATIVKAMEEGRSIYTNIRKAIRYLIATNVGEVILMLLAAVFGMPLPLLPIQLLWINLIGDGLPAIALVNDPSPKNIMQDPPRSADVSVFADGLGQKILTRGVSIGIVSLALFARQLRSSGSLAAARTMVLVQLAVSQFIHVFDCRVEKRSGRVGLLSNGWLVGAVALSMLMVFGIVHIPVLQPIFGTVRLTVTEWFMAFGVAGTTALLDAGMSSIAKRIWPENAAPTVPCVPALMPPVV